MYSTAEGIEDRIDQWFAAKVVQRGECQVWTGANDARFGRPIARFDSTWVDVKRVVYNEMCSLVGMKETVFSTCGTQLCVNPDHLDARLSKPGIAGRMANARKNWETTGKDAA